MCTGRPHNPLSRLCPSCRGLGYLHRLPTAICPSCRGAGVICACGGRPSLVQHTLTGDIALCAACRAARHDYHPVTAPTHGEEV